MVGRGSERFRRIERLFHEALELSPERRPAHVAEQCADDPSLGEEVEALVAHAEIGSGFLTLSPTASPSASPSGPPPDAAPEATTATPSRLGNYDLLEEIARGGMGIVYRARDRATERIVAVKSVLGGALASAEERERFRREGRSMARLDHPHIAPLYEAGEDCGIPYFALKLLEGGNLSAALERFHGDPRETARLLEKVSRAVHFGHSRGILHRDLKPANILLDTAGEPYVSDFGLARPLEGKGSLTWSGAVLGTAAYMPPEQADGRLGELTAASDVYSLGAILYELLAGSPPFTGGTSMETLLRILTEEPRRPCSPSTAIPIDLEAICLKCLEKRPQDRYASALHLAEDLRRYLEGEPVRARRIGALRRGLRWCRRHPAQTTIAILLVLLVVGVGIAARAINASRDGAVASLRHSLIDRARLGALSRRPGQRLEGLEAIREAARHGGSLELRNVAAACLALIDLREARSWEGFPTGSSTIALDPALERYALGDLRGIVTVRAVEGGREIARWEEGKAEAQILRFDPHGARLAIKVRRTDLDGDLWTWSWLEADPGVHIPELVHDEAFDFNPTGEEIALVDPEGTLHIRRLPSHQEIRSWSTDGPCHRLAFSPDGTRLAAARGAAVVIWMADDGAPAGKLEHEGLVSSLSWQPGGRLLATTVGSVASLWDPWERKLLRRFRCSDTNGAQLSFHPAGDLLASSGWEGLVRVFSLGGRELLRLERDAPVLSWSADGSRLGHTLSLKTVSLWDLVRGRVHRSLHGSGWLPGPLTIHPGGRILAARELEGLRLWDLATGKEIFHLPVAGIRAVFFHAGSGDLIVGSTSGFERRALRRSPAPSASEECFHLGPPVRLESRPESARNVLYSGLAGGRILARTEGTHRVFLLDLDDDCRPLVSFEHPNATWGAVAPDGSRLAVGPHHGIELTTRSAEDGGKLWSLPAPVNVLSARPIFSPDGSRLLVSTMAGYQELDIATGHPLRTFATTGKYNLPAPMAFSDDGTLLVVTVLNRKLQLLDGRTLEELVTLDAPEPGIIQDVAISADGRFLAASVENLGIQTWDLHELRRELRVLGLEWPSPVPAPLQAGEPPLLRIEADPGWPPLELEGK